MKPAFTFYVLFVVMAAAAQTITVIDVDKSEGTAARHFYTVGGEPFINVRFVRLTAGTPYFMDNWLKATAVSDKNNLYKSPQAKLDLLDNRVLFLGQAGREMIATIALKEITLTDTITGNNYHFLHSHYHPFLSSARRGWHLRLSSGRALLFQYFDKAVQEYKQYGSATAEQKIHTSSLFYLLHNDRLVQIKKPKDVPAILNDKEKELEAYLHAGDPKNKSTATLLAGLIQYYNSLFD